MHLYRFEKNLNKNVLMGLVLEDREQFESYDYLVCMEVTAKSKFIPLALYSDSQNCRKSGRMAKNI